MPASTNGMPVSPCCQARSLSAQGTLALAGLLEGSAKPRKSHFFKSEKTLEAARERGRKLAEAKKAQRETSS